MLPIKKYLDHYNRALLLITMFLLPVAIAPLNIAFWLLTAGLLVSFPMLDWPPVFRQPVIICLGLLLLLAFIGIAYSQSPTPIAWNTFRKELPWLVMIFLAAWLINYPEAIFQRAMQILVLSSVLISLIGIANSIGLIHVPVLMKYSAYTKAFPFMHHIYGSLTTTFAAFVALYLGLDRREKWGWYLAAFLIIGVNVLFFSDARTGQVLYLLALLLLMLQVFPKRYWLYGLLGGAAAAIIIFSVSKQMQRDFAMVKSDITHYYQKETVTSVGVRITEYTTGWQLFTERPLFGFGTGGYVAAYGSLKSFNVEQLNQFTAPTDHTNPENTYLFLAIELGLPGLILFLALLYFCLRETARLPWLRRATMQLFLMMLIIGSLSQTLILSNVSRIWFIVVIPLCLFSLFREKSCFQRS